MANHDHLNILGQGVRVWNEWTRNNGGMQPDLREARLAGLKLVGANLNGANLSNADLQEVDLRDAFLSEADLNGAYLYNAYLDRANLRGANLRGAYLHGAYLRGANLRGAQLDEAYLVQALLMGAYLSNARMAGAYLDGADLRGARLFDADLSRAHLNDADLRWAYLREANLIQAHLIGTDLSEADLTGADLRGATAIQTKLSKANLSGCRIFGISAWGVELTEAIQLDLIITDDDNVDVTVDNLEVAQFIYVLLRNEKIRDIIDTISKKVVLILGRFTPERKIVLDAIRQELRKHNYTPILFDFDKPSSRSLTETVVTLASIACFVIADLSDPNSIPYELMSFAAKVRSVPIQAIFCPVPEHMNEFPMFRDLQDLRHVLPIYRYDTQEKLITVLYEKVIQPAEEKVKQLRPGS